MGGVISTNGMNGCRIILLLGVAVEVDAGLAPAAGEAAHLTPEAHALHAAGARRRAGAALQHLAAPSLLLVIAGHPGGVRVIHDKRWSDVRSNMN